MAPDWLAAQPGFTQAANQNLCLNFLLIKMDSNKEII